MSSISQNWRLVAVGACCAAIGAGGSAIAAAGASTTSHSAKTTAAHAKATAAHAPRGGLRRLARRAVHGSAVVHTRAGFRTVTYDRGVVDSVSGDQIKLTEGTPRATYRTVTLTVPAAVHVRDNGAQASMSSVTAGQRAMVIQLPKRTVVIARTPKHAAA